MSVYLMNDNNNKIVKPLRLFVIPGSIKVNTPVLVL